MRTTYARRLKRPARQCGLAKAVQMMRLKPRSQPSVARSWPGRRDTDPDKHRQALATLAIEVSGTGALAAPLSPHSRSGHPIQSQFEHRGGGFFALHTFGYGDNPQRVGEGRHAAQ